MSNRALLLTLIGLLCACQPPPPREALDHDALQVQVGQLASVAAEADLMARELAVGHTSRSFAWVHQQSLGDQAGKAASELARPAPAALQPAQQQALQVAAALRLAVSRIAATQDDAPGLLELRKQFAGLQSRMKQIAEVAP